VATERPYVVWKFGASLDGRLAAADGSSQWITSEEARTDAHRLRAESDAVMVGSGTQRIDNPHLAVRHVEAARQPLRVVVDTEGRTPADARVLDDVAPTLIAVAEDAATRHFGGRVTVERLPRAAGGGLDLVALLTALGKRGVRRILLEGGPTLAGSFVAAGLVDEVVAYIAPALIGGGGLSALGGQGAPSIEQVRRFELVEVTRIGPDVKLVARPVSRRGDRGRGTRWTPTPSGRT
jgi:diaminohydroxyphosphoribosylaminopyrimidine deaminase / 5-amino-6-(5-phosphoribosylamino)uracil reductase